MKLFRKNDSNLSTMEKVSMAEIAINNRDFKEFKEWMTLIERDDYWSYEYLFKSAANVFTWEQMYGVNSLLANMYV